MPEALNTYEPSRPEQLKKSLLQALGVHSMEFAFKIDLRAQNGLEEAGTVLNKGPFFSGHRHNLN